MFLISEVKGLFFLRVIECEYKLKSVQQLGSDKVFEVLPPENVVLMSGVGRPESFTQLIKRNDFKVLYHFSFPDHHDFKEDEINEVLRFAKAKGIKKIFITDKDAVKLKKYPQFFQYFFTVKIELKPSSSIEGLYEKIISYTN